MAGKRDDTARLGVVKVWHTPASPKVVVVRTYMIGQMPKVETPPGLADCEWFGLLKTATTGEEVAVGVLHLVDAHRTFLAADEMVIRHYSPYEAPM